jgi:hypothetical protein
MWPFSIGFFFLATILQLLHQGVEELLGTVMRVSTLIAAVAASIAVANAQPSTGGSTFYWRHDNEW